MDKNGKLFGKISIVDLIVLLLVLAVAAEDAQKLVDIMAEQNEKAYIIGSVTAGENPFTLQ